MKRGPATEELRMVRAELEQLLKRRLLCALSVEEEARYRSLAQLETALLSSR